jgi:Acetyltransferase (GNAT) family
MEDIDDVIRLSHEFYQNSPYSDFDWDEGHAREMAGVFLTSSPQDKIVILAEEEEPVGIIVGLVSSLPMTKSKMAAEFLWWVSEPFRKTRAAFMLFDSYEYWAKNVAKADKIQSVSLSNLDVSKLYEKRGYRMTEKAFIKDLT